MPSPESHLSFSMVARATAWLVVLATAWLCAPPAAQAYRRSESDQGIALWWQERSVGYVLDDAGCADLDRDLTFDALRGSFATWAAVQCSYGLLDPTLVDGGVAGDREVGFDLGGTNENLMVFHANPADWEHSRTAIAMTLVTHDPYTGRIYDADIEFNDADFTFRADNLPVLPGSDAQDLANTATHEIGHLIGLDHSEQEQATMWGEAPAGERKKRTLSADDEDGVCSITRPDGSGGDGANDDADASPGCHCRAARAGRGRAAGVWLATLLVGIGLATLRRRLR